MIYLIPESYNWIFTLRYQKKVTLYNERVEELNSVTQERDDVKRQYDEWRKKRQVFIFLSKILFLHLNMVLISQVDGSFSAAVFRLEEFMEGFNMISLKLKEMYQVIFDSLISSSVCRSVQFLLR